MTRAGRLTLWVSAAAVLAVLATLVRVDTDATRFIASGERDRQLSLVAGLQRSAAGRVVIVALRSADAAGAARASRALAAELRDSGEFLGVYNGEAALAPADMDFLVAHRYVLSDRVDARTFSVDGLRASLGDAAGMLADSRAWLVEQLLPRDPTLETLHLAEQWSAPMGLPLRGGVWFARDGSAAVLIAMTRAAGDDSSAQRTAGAALQAAFARVAAPPADLTLRYSGLGLLEAEARATTQARVERLGMASALLVIVILWLGYRRLLPVVYSMLPVALGLAAGTALTHLLFGDVNLLAIAFACVLIDEGSDYPSYLLTQARSDERIGDAVRRVWPTLRLAVLTSVAAFAVLLFAQFRGLQQLGLLCATGLLVAGGAARWLVPDLLGRDASVAWGPPRFVVLAGTDALSTTSMPAPARATRRNRTVWLATAAVMLAATAVLSTQKPLWNDDVAAINPLPRERIAQDRALRAIAGLPLDHALLIFISGDDQAVLRAQEAWLPTLRGWRSRGTLTSFDLAARYLPSVATQRERLAALPPVAELRARLLGAAENAGFVADAFEPMLTDAAQPRPTPLTLATLPDGPLQQRAGALLMHADDDGPWIGLASLAGAASREEVLVSARTAALPYGVEVEWFEPRQRLVDLLHAVRARLVNLLGLCTLAVFVVIAVHHRSLRVAVRVMLPVVAALLLTAATARALLGPLTVFHAVALLLLLGLLTNYALFVHVPPPNAAAARDGSRTLFSLLIASATTLAVFGALAVSGIGVVEAVGRTVVLGIIVGLAWIALTRRVRPAAAAAPSLSDTQS